MPPPVTCTGRVVIVGGGIAALSAALALSPHPVLLLTPDPLGTGASSAWAQGGVAAAMAPDDSTGDHLADTMRAGAGLVDAAVARAITAEAPQVIATLAALGAPFDRDAHGGYLLSREAAHGRARVVRVGGDRAGQAIMATLIRAVAAAPQVQVAEGMLATGLVLTGSRVRGVTVEGAAGQGTLLAPAVILAGGGAAGLYAVTTNPGRIRGQMLGMAARAGAVIRDAEFVQFHPTAIDTGEDPAPLATEALRGEGAVLVNREGLRFMPAVATEAELAPRDIVARAVFREAQAGRRPMLDTRAAPGAALDTVFPTVFAACLRAGIDPRDRPIPVTAAAHYHMGGIAVDLAGRTSLPGLWAAGECACTGLHGANRLASNGLLEALSLGHRAGRDVAAAVLPGPAAPVEVALAGAAAAASPQDVASLRGIMAADVGVVRTADGLHRALAAIAALDTPDRPAAFRNMAAAARMIAAAALARAESRGAHCRADAPETRPELARPTLMRLAGLNEMEMLT